MGFTKLSALAVVALSLIATDSFASPVNRKFHPVVNDDPQNAHLNVQTPGADINQTVTIQAEPGTDGQVIPAGDTKVAACALKGANGDIDLSGGGSCWSPKASAPTAEHVPVTAATTVATIGQAPAPRTVSRTGRVPSVTVVPITRAATVNTPSAAPIRATHAVEAARMAAPSPAHRALMTRAAAYPAKPLSPAIRADVAARDQFVRMQWLIIGAAAALLLLAIGIGIMIRMGLGNLLVMRRPVEDEEPAVRVVHDRLPSPRIR